MWPSWEGPGGQRTLEPIFWVCLGTHEPPQVHGRPAERKFCCWFCLVNLKENKASETTQLCRAQCSGPGKERKKVTNAQSWETQGSYHYQSPESGYSFWGGTVTGTGPGRGHVHSNGWYFPTLEVVTRMLTFNKPLCDQKVRELLPGEQKGHERGWNCHLSWSKFWLQQSVQFANIWVVYLDFQARERGVNDICGLIIWKVVGASGWTSYKNAWYRRMKAMVELKCWWPCL